MLTTLSWNLRCSVHGVQIGDAQNADLSLLESKKSPILLQIKLTMTMIFRRR
ncbi:MAG UNVERIFIED_CONTAM: hypothetical protein LVT10_20150 [Anaerolineae bacterium]